MSQRFVTDLAQALGFGENTRLAQSIDIKLRADSPVVELVAKEIASDAEVSQVTDMLKERHYQLVRWIAVDEQRPPTDEDVIIWDPVTRVSRPARAISGSDLKKIRPVINIDESVAWLDFTVPGLDKRFLATHWMPRLQPPKCYRGSK
jgi:hypothetical protein